MPAIPCSYLYCRSKRDCENVGSNLQLRREEANKDFCRPVRSHCKVFRFCCNSHRQKSKAGAREDDQKQDKGRQALNLEQTVYLLLLFIKQTKPYMAAMVLLQLCLGERVDAVRQAARSWFKGLEQDSRMCPKVAIPKVNGKTVAREVELPLSIAEQFRKWLSQSEALRSFQSQWPMIGQPLHEETCVLFPGKTKWQEQA